MTDKNIVLKVGIGEYEGKQYTYLYVLLNVNGVESEIKLKAHSTFEKNLLVNEINKISSLRK